MLLNLHVLLFYSKLFLDFYISDKKIERMERRRVGKSKKLRLEKLKKISEKDEKVKSKSSSSGTLKTIQPLNNIENISHKITNAIKTISFGLLGDDLIEKFINNKSVDHIKEPSNLSNEDKILYSSEDVSHLNSNNSLQNSSLDNNSISTNNIDYVSNECMKSSQNESFEKNNSEAELLSKKCKSQSMINSEIETSKKEDLDEIIWDLSFLNSEGMYLLMFFYKYTFVVSIF